MRWILSLMIMMMMAAGDVMMVGTYPACDDSQMAVLECFKFLFDLNHDNVVTFAEVDERFAMNITGVPQPFHDTQTIKNCDVDHDGNLTMSDWDSPNRTCLKFPGATTIACNVCEVNGFVMTPPDYFVQPTKRSNEPRHVHFTKQQMDDHAQQDHVHADQYKKAAMERLDRHKALMERFEKLEKWKRKRLQEQALKGHMQLTAKRVGEIKKRLIEL